MNKYTAIGLLAAASEGKRIIVVSPHDRAVRDAVDEVRRMVPGLQWRRANGDARVTLPSGGSIRFLADTERLRGHRADIVLVEDDHDLNLRHDLHALIKSSPDGELVRY